MHVDDAKLSGSDFALRFLSPVLPHDRTAMFFRESEPARRDESIRADRGLQLLKPQDHGAADDDHCGARAGLMQADRGILAWVARDPHAPRPRPGVERFELVDDRQGEGDRLRPRT